MPPRRQPRASFEPISPDLDVAALVESTPNFEYVVRINCDAIDEQGIDDFEKLVQLHVILGGKPLVIEGYQHRLERWTFSTQWLKDNCGDKAENARNLTTKLYLPLSIQHYLNKMPLLADQWSATNYKDADRQRIYLKDIDCPPLWYEKLKGILPPFLCYLNESNLNAPGGPSKSGDLMSSLPPEMRAENLMCYIGHEGTYTPSHREMCASLGHNIMVETSTGTAEDGKVTKPGSSIWFMTETNDRHSVSEYWRSRLGHDIEIEDHFAQINAWKLAPFKTYIVEQRVGDFILIPPLAPHQVWNRGTRTMKVAWNRTTAETLEMAINEALPKASMVCRDEQYKNKAIIYYTLMKYSDILQTPDLPLSPKIKHIQRDFRRLFGLYTQILLSESFSRDLPEPKNVEYIPFTSNIMCSYCRCNIFNRFLTCPSCVGKLADGDDDNYDICMECYSIGRSCACISKLKWAEQFKWKDLVKKHEHWRNQVLQLRSRTSNAKESLEPLLVERDRLGRRTLAEICQDELKRRPWNDISKPVTREERDEVIETNDDGQIRKRRKIRRSEKFRQQHASCHICKTPEPRWKLASCQCGLNYCYGSLYRAFDKSPRDILKDLHWKCPKCQKICSCGACRRDPMMKPYEPTGTLLGHDTRKVADIRSVETLVDFSHSNMTWIIKAGDHGENNTETRRLKRTLEEAERAKQHDPVLDDDHEDHVHLDAGDALGSPHPAPAGVDPESTRNLSFDDDGNQIDPALIADSAVQNYSMTLPDNAVFIEEMTNRYEVTEAITFEYADLETPVPISQSQNKTSAVKPGVEERNTIHGQGSIIDRNADDGLIQSDLAIDPALTLKRNSHKNPEISHSKEDADFMPDAGSLRDVRNGSSRAVTRRKRARVRYTEDPIILSDPEESETQAVQNQENESEAQPLQPSDNMENISDNEDNVANNDSLDPLSTSAYAQQALDLSQSSSQSTSAESSFSDENNTMTQAEKNRRAKLMAMHWAAGDTADIDSEEWI